MRGHVNQSRVLISIKKYEVRKTPGSDGLRVEFHNVFWNEISDCLLTQLTTLIPKENFQ